MSVVTISSGKANMINGEISPRVKPKNFGNMLLWQFLKAPSDFFQPMTVLF